MTSKTMSAKTHELKNLFKEIEFNLADARSIRVHLNNTAISFGLQPLTADENH